MNLIGHAILAVVMVVFTMYVTANLIFIALHLFARAISN